jgi:hypothetical protein
MTSLAATIMVSASLNVAMLTGPASAARAEADETRFGVIASTQGSAPDTFTEYIRLYDIHRRYYSAPLGIRIFAGVDGRLALPTDRTQPGQLLAWAAREHPDEPITISHKIRDDARLQQLLDWVKSTGVRLTVIYRHEAQPDWFRDGQEGAKPDVFRATYRAYRSIIAAHPAKAQVTLEKNLMWYWQYHEVKRKGKTQSDWRKYVELNDPADVLSWDVYAFPGMPTKQGHYGTPDDFFRYARDAWRQFHLPWGVGEIGSIVQDGTGGRCTEKDWDRAGNRFTAWVHEMTAAARNPAGIDSTYLGMPPARFMKWWGAVDADECDLSLEQVPAAAAAYRSLVQENHF